MFPLATLHGCCFHKISRSRHTPVLVLWPLQLHGHTRTFHTVHSVLAFIRSLLARFHGLSRL